MKFFIFFIITLFLLTGCTKGNNNATSENYNNSMSKNNDVTFSRTSYTEPIEEELAAFSTIISTKESGRQNNVELTCNKINGNVINIGETFSFCDIVGPGTPQNGYEKADIFESDGDIVEGYGGGKCQVSSTLYNAVLAVDGLTVIERHPHSREVDYVETGKDATVAYGSLDFKFKNDTSNKVKIYAQATKDEITIKIVKIS